MPTVRMRVLLFLSSYFPLFLIISVLVFPKNWLVAVVIFFLDICFVVALWRYLRYCQRKHQRAFIRLRNYQQRDSEAMSYIASYVVPFASFSLDIVPQVIALTIFILMLLALYVNSNMIYVNPMLNLVGYHLYEIEIEHSNHSHYYLARKRLARDEIIYYVQVSGDVLLESKP
jgi:hypothetical protein